MRGYVRGAGTLLAFSFFLALINSCSLNNGILKPSCTIFPIHLVEYTWLPQPPFDQRAPLIFRSTGVLEVAGVHDSITYTLQDCDRLEIINHNRYSLEHWHIKRLTDVLLDIHYPQGYTVHYTRAR
ncbi:MAG: hypothetical protein KatS3mg031_0421 [Chitinophagales bacterium]|nr:MAG: hypothetical protein KatS3mg031_0421 [Chitinophagales bacterium]